MFTTLRCWNISKTMNCSCWPNLVQIMSWPRNKIFWKKRWLIVRQDDSAKIANLLRNMSLLLRWCIKELFRSWSIPNFVWLLICCAIISTRESNKRGLSLQWLNLRNNSIVSWNHPTQRLISWNFLCLLEIPGTRPSQSTWLLSFTVTLKWEKLWKKDISRDWSFQRHQLKRETKESTFTICSSQSRGSKISQSILWRGKHGS